MKKVARKLLLSISILVLLVSTGCSSRRLYPAFPPDGTIKMVIVADTADNDEMIPAYREAVSTMGERLNGPDLEIVNVYMENGLVLSGDYHRRMSGRQGQRMADSHGVDGVIVIQLERARQWFQDDSGCSADIGLEAWGYDFTGRDLSVREYESIMITATTCGQAIREAGYFLGNRAAYGLYHALEKVTQRTWSKDHVNWPNTEENPGFE